jgi:hypothetical protein
VRQTSHTDKERDAVLEMVESLLRPFMPVFFEYGVDAYHLTQTVRSLYVEAIRRRLEERGRTPTSARLGMMAGGIAKAEVESLVAGTRARSETRAREVAHMHQVAVLLTTWNENPRFTTPYGAPLDLSLFTDEAHRTFNELLKESAPTLDAESTIKFLTNVGCAEVHGATAQRYLRCTKRSLTLARNEIGQIAHIGEVAALFNSTLVHNFLDDEAEDQIFERTLLSNGPIAPDARRRLLIQLKDVGDDFISELDKWVSANLTPPNEGESGSRCGVHLFFFDESHAAWPVETDDKGAEQRERVH